jgi:hypothetical protein
VLLATSGLLAAWWVGHVIQRRDANERAIKELVTGFCRDLLASLAQLSGLIENCPVGQTVPDGSRHSLHAALTNFSNCLLVIEESVKQWGIDSTKCASFSDLKKMREDLRSGILDPLATTGTFEATQIRQINGEVSKTKLTIIRFQLEIIKNL